MITSYARRFRHGLAVTVSCLAACGLEPLAVNGSPSRTLRVALGQELDITLQTIGPGRYDSLPAISSPAIRFLDMSFVGPAVPAGPTQLFRFKAEARGQAVVSFYQSTVGYPIVIDTVEVH